VVGLGTRHTLASNLSRQTVPASTASPPHFVTGIPGKLAADALAAPIISPTAKPTVKMLCFIIGPFDGHPG
jgi:hypothetical protein